MAVAPDSFLFGPDKTRDDSDSVFKPITPIVEPAYVPEPESMEDPFVALSPDVTAVDLPSNKKPANPLPTGQLPSKASPQPPLHRAPPGPARRPTHFVNENISITIAPEFAAAPPSPQPKTAMDFSVDYKNPEAERIASATGRPEARICFKCKKQIMNTTFFYSNKGLVCLRCYNPYFHRLTTLPGSDQGRDFESAKVLRATVNFIITWLVPIVPAIAWYGLLVRTGFGGFFEDCVVIAVAPTVAGLVFVALLAAGVFFIPAIMASVSRSKGPGDLLKSINPGTVFIMVRQSSPGYFCVFIVLAATVLLNTAGLSFCADAGAEVANSVMALPIAVCISAIEMALFRAVLRSLTVRKGPFRENGSASINRKQTAA